MTLLKVIVLSRKKKKRKKKHSENDQSTGHFQSFFIYFFSSPPTLGLKKIPVNQLIKKIWPKQQISIFPPSLEWSLCGGGKLSLHDIWRQLLTEQMQE